MYSNDCSEDGWNWAALRQTEHKDVTKIVKEPAGGTLNIRFITDRDKISAFTPIIFPFEHSWW